MEKDCNGEEVEVVVDGLRNFMEIGEKGPPVDI